MKRLILTILSLAMTVSILAQKTPASGSDGSILAPTRDNEFQCLPNSVFSQVHPTYNDGFWGDTGYPVELIDDYTATGPFSSLRFWGANYYGCGIGATQTFNIKLYERNLTYPNQLGTLYWSGTFIVTPLNMDIISFNNSPLYQVDIELGTTIDLLDGWVSIQRQNPGDGCNFAGIILSNVGGNAATITEGGAYLFQDYKADLLFCLGGETQEVPVSNWALFIGIGLILVFTVIRFRKMV